MKAESKQIEEALAREREEAVRQKQALREVRGCLVGRGALRITGKGLRWRHLFTQAEG